jgi:anthranilate phosphoribosyltransferase
MGIAKYIKEIGRGKEGARSLSREQAADLMGQVLDGAVTDLEIGGFCLAMRIKGETAQEMAGFLDAVHARMSRLPTDRPVVVIPSYNGARKLPLLTPLLAALLAREGQRLGAQHGFGVLVHGTRTEEARVSVDQVWPLLGDQFFDQNRQFARIQPAQSATEMIVDGKPTRVTTEQLSPALKRLLDVRRAVGLRNPAHSLVKLMNPTTHPGSLVISSYTHPEYLHSMGQTLALSGQNALLLRGTEGEAVADPRRRPPMDGFVAGARIHLCDVQDGSLASLPELPQTTDPQAAADYTLAVLRGSQAIPAPIAAQVEHILHLMKHIRQTERMETSA